MRTKFIQDDLRTNRCTIESDDVYGNRVSRDFFAPEDGGHVKYDWSNPRQICEGLAAQGPTLTWHPSEKTPTLGALLRREHRRYLRASGAVLSYDG